MRVLFTVLNWGMGHASRSIPIIQEMESLGWQVMIASDGAAKDLLEKEFPNKEIFVLPNYRIAYPFAAMWLNGLFLALPVLKSIHREHQQMQQWIQKFQIDVIFSDNRYGCYSEKVPSIFLSHQLHIHAKPKWLQPILNGVQQKLWNRFREIWVFDAPQAPGLAGDISHPALTQKLCRYIGGQSRFVSLSDLQKRRDIIIVLSGPEPQRSLLEELIVEQLSEASYLKVLLVRGKKGDTLSLPAHIEQCSIMEAKLLNVAIQESRLFIGRSGYSTLMDLSKLRVPALLIPTPGQTEQEYLAQIWANKEGFLAQDQNQIDVLGAFETLKSYERTILQEENQTYLAEALGSVKLDLMNSH